MKNDSEPKIVSKISMELRDEVSNQAVMLVLFNLHYVPYLLSTAKAGDSATL